LSENNNEHNLCVKIPIEIMKEFNTEVVYKFGKTYGNMEKCVKEAMKLWADKSKKGRMEKQKST